MAEVSDRATEDVGSTVAGMAAPGASVAAASPAAGGDAQAGIGHIGGILIATLGTWLVLLAIPGVFVWDTADNGDRAILVGAAVMSAVALLSIPISLIWRKGWGAGAAWAGLAASLLSLGFAALQVVRTLVAPASISRDVVLGVGLLVILGFAFLLAWRRQVAGVPRTARVSSLTLLGSLTAVVLIAAYLLLTNSLLNVIKAPAEDWVRYTDLRNGLEALAFAAAGALLGTTIQKQSTDRAANRADENASAATANYVIAARALDLAARDLGVAPMDEAAAAVAARDQAAQARELRAQLRLPR